MKSLLTHSAFPNSQSPIANSQLAGNSLAVIAGVRQNIDIILADLKRQRDGMNREALEAETRSTSMHGVVDQLRDLRRRSAVTWPHPATVPGIKGR